MDIKQTLLEFNRDQENRDIMAFYNRKSYMELTGVARREESHSAFLAWLLKGSDIPCGLSESPLMWFLNVIVLRENTKINQNNPISPELKTAILTRTLQFHILEVKPEKKIHEIKTKYPNKQEANFFDLFSGAPKCEDELDIYIKCSIQGFPNCDELEIFVENKITSPEEGPKSKIERKGYDDLSQTERYYKACSYYRVFENNNKILQKDQAKKIQLFVYLHPDKLNENSKASCKSKDFVQISYQDLLDYILTPIQNTIDSDRVRFVIQEYIDCLSLPTEDVKANKRIVMARTNDEEKNLNGFINKNHPLLYNIMRVYLKNKYGITLNDDEKILLSFANENSNLINAVISFGTININTPTYIINGEWKPYTNSGFGFRFAEIFAQHFEDKVQCVDDLISKLNKEIGLKAKSMYSSTHKKGTKKIDFSKFSLFATTNSWETKPSGLLTRLENALKNHPLDFFSWEKIG